MSCFFVFQMVAGTHLAKRLAKLPVFLDELPEFIKEVARVMRSGRCLRMILHTKHRLGLMAKPFHRLVVQINPVYRYVAWQRIGINGEPMVL